MQRERYQEAIEKRIDTAVSGSVFVLSDFSDIAAPDAVRKAITRIEGKGMIKRVFRGVYQKPEYSAFLSEFVAPSPDAVAHALARGFGWTIVPCGDSALNLLGLSTQVPSAWVYASDGTYKEYTLGRAVIRFRRVANKEISNLSYKTALVIQALRALGREHITEGSIARLKRNLTHEEKARMLSEAKPVTAWIYAYIKEIGREEA